MKKGNYSQVNRVERKRVVSFFLKTITLLLLLTVATCFVLAQNQVVAKGEYVTWKVWVEPKDVRAGEGAALYVSAEVRPAWHIYSLIQKGGPLPTSFSVGPDSSVVIKGNILESKPKKSFDPNFEVNVQWHEGKVAFYIPIKLKQNAKGRGFVNLTIRWMACSETTCTPPQTTNIKLNFKVSPGKARSAHFQPPKPRKEVLSVKNLPIIQTENENNESSGDASSSDIEHAKDKGLLAYLLLSFLAGLGALATPCVFPMIPITVSYFSKRGEGGKSLLLAATSYCVGIIATFTGLGVFVSAVFGGTKITDFATHPITNLALAVLFILLALNLFGVYEIRLPNWLVSRLYFAGRRGGLAGPFFMGLAFTLTSFTCTLAFVGTIFAQAATGEYFYPLVGMLAFSFAFALPFFLLAIFPHFVSRMPKSGGWMESVKVYMGFIELVAAVKFLSNADLVWGTWIMPRPVFLAVWVVILSIAGFYMLGWLRFPTETAKDVRGWGRISVGVITLLVAGYFLAGIGGKQLGEWEAFLPPDRTTEWLTDYDKALATAKKEGKNILIDFTGVTCTNCRWMEKNMFTKPEVLSQFRNFVLVRLYTDRVGDEKNRELQIRLTGLTTLPIYVILSPDGTVLKRFEGSTRDLDKFLAFLQIESRVAYR